MIFRLAAALRSVRLTLGLLLILASLALMGTIPRVPEAADRSLPTTKSVERFFGVRDPFRSPVFLVATVLLTANILFCTVHRFGRSQRNRTLMLSDLVMHLALVLVIAGGAVKAIAGAVRTVSVHVGKETNTIFDWRVGADVPLGFALRVVRFETEYHPFRARIGLSDPRSAEKTGVFEVAQGRAGGVLPGGVAIGFLAVDQEQGRARFMVETPEAQGQIALELASGPGSQAQFGGVAFTLVAYQHEEKMVRALVSAVQESGLVAERWLSPNEGVEIQGTRISLTAWGRDEFGNRFAGFQVAHDPGAPLFWVGCLLLSGAIPLHFLLRIRRRRGDADRS